MMHTEFSKRLREVRDKLNLTQKELAEKLGCSRASYAYYETGKNTPDITILKSLYDFTKFPLEYLLGYTDNHTEQTVGLDKTLRLSTEVIEAVKNDSELSSIVNRLFLEAATLTKEGPTIYPENGYMLSKILVSGLLLLSLKMFSIRQYPEQFFAIDQTTGLYNKEAIDMFHLEQYLGFKVDTREEEKAMKNRLNNKSS